MKLFKFSNFFAVNLERLKKKYKTREFKIVMDRMKPKTVLENQRTSADAIDHVKLDGEKVGKRNK